MEPTGGTASGSLGTFTEGRLNIIHCGSSSSPALLSISVAGNFKHNLGLQFRNLVSTISLLNI